MRSALYLIPLSALALPAAAEATVYLSPEQAQNLMFPGETLKPDFHELTPEQVGAIRKQSGEAPLSRSLRAWRASRGGWFIVDEVVGKHEFIAFALGLDPAGAVKDVEILEYREAYGAEVRGAAWRAQFNGKRRGAPLKLGQDIKNISGATLSSKHVADGVRRLLATYAVVLNPAAH